MKFIKLLLSVAALCFFACQDASKDLIYIEKAKPGLTPLLFSKGFVSIDSISEFGSVFNSKGNEFYFGVDVNGKAHISFTQLKEGKWTSPVQIIHHEKYSFNDPFLSPDEQRLYYISDKPLNAQDSIRDYDIWYSKKNENGWSDPINVGAPINTEANEYYISFTEDGSMYFSSNWENRTTNARDFDIYKSAYKNNVFEKPSKLDSSINTTNYEADVYISPKEDYMIFCSQRRSGLGRGDLYISFKDENGNWKEAESLGEPINTVNHELCPYVTPDGKYFLYTSNQDIYWVSTKYFDKFK